MKKGGVCQQSQVMQRVGCILGSEKKMRTRFSNALVVPFAPQLFLLASSSHANFLSLVGGVSAERFRLTILMAKPSDGKDRFS